MSDAELVLGKGKYVSRSKGKNIARNSSGHTSQTGVFKVGPSTEETHVEE